MSAEMYTILGVGVGMMAVIVALFAATWQMINARFNAASSDSNARFDDSNARFTALSNDMNARFIALSNDMNARFEESNQRYLLLVEQNRELISEVSQLSQRVARLEGLLRLPHEIDGRGED